MTDTPKVQGLARTKRAQDSSIPMPPRRWKTRLLLPAAVFATLLALLLYSTWDLLMPATPVRATAVILKSVTGEAQGSITVQAPGWLEPAPHPHVVAALTDGVVEELLVLEGDVVEAGQVVARLIDDDAVLAVNRATAILAERRAAIAVAEADLTAAQRHFETLIQPTEFAARAHAELAVVDAERSRLAARIRVAESTALATEDELERKSRLVESQAVPLADVQRLRIRLDAERAELEAIRAEIPIVAARRKSAVARQEAAQRALELRIEERRAVARAEAGLASSRAAERAAAAALAEAELRLERTNVRSPVAGVVMSRVVSPGTTLHTSGPQASAIVVELYDPEHLQVRVDVPLADAARVGLNQRVEIVVDALPDRVFEGSVARLVHLADVAKNTVEVKVTVRDPAPILKPQMLARVQFLATPSADGETAARQRVFAPRDAIRAAGGESATVLVVAGRKADRGWVEVRSVTLGSTTVEDHIEVRTGLRAGDHVILNPPPGLEAGARVIITAGDH